MNKPTESQVLRACLDYLKHDRRVAWSCRMNSGALKVGEDGRERFVRFGSPGLPDILGQLNDGRILMIEVKRPGGRATDNQLAFLSKVNKANGVAGIAESVHDVQRLLAMPQLRRSDGDGLPVRPTPRYTTIGQPAKNLGVRPALPKRG